jgi:hypothetical protein
VFCPNCQAEYRAGFTRCADCDVDLVESLDQVVAANPSTQRELRIPELLWSGFDNSTLEQIRDALDHANILYNDETLEAHLLYASMRNPLEIWVQRQDLEAAKAAVSTLFAPGNDDLLNNPDDPLAPPPPPEPDPTSDFRPNADNLDEFDEDEEANQFDEPPMSQIWSGRQPDMARILKDCLREHGLRGHIIHEEAGALSLWVDEKVEDRAKKIVREVLDATPSE